MVSSLSSLAWWMCHTSFSTPYLPPFSMPPCKHECKRWMEVSRNARPHVSGVPCEAIPMARRRLG